MPPGRRRRGFGGTVCFWCGGQVAPSTETWYTSYLEMGVQVVGIRICGPTCPKRKDQSYHIDMGFQHLGETPDAWRRDSDRRAFIAETA